MSLQTFIIGFVAFLNATLIPFLLAVGFLFIVINAIRFFVIQSPEEEGRTKAKALAVYGIAAFVAILVFWGVVNLISSSLALECDTIQGSDVQSDYVKNQQNLIGPTPAPCR